MPMLGSAAMLLSFDVAPEAAAEHDDWHTHEHLPERLSIPGFLRGTRWVAQSGQPRYLVVYEVAQLETLASEPYMARLNNPSAWTARMMPHYRGMSRGFCSVSGSFGFGVGHIATLVRFKPPPQAQAVAGLREWLLHHALAPLPAQPGMGSAHLLEGAMTPAMTNEQRIRGADAGVDWALLLTAYSPAALAAAAVSEMASTQLESRGASGVIAAEYKLHYCLTHDEMR